MTGLFQTLSLEYPLALTFILPVLLLLLLLLRHEFLKMDLDDRTKRRIKAHRMILLVTRSIIFICLLVVIASPYYMMQDTDEGYPYVTIIFDNTTSFDLFDDYSYIVDSIKNDVKVNIETINEKDTSAIGDILLKAAKESDNLLLVSDGQNNYGADLSDVAVFFTSENITLNMLDIQPSNHDASISINGPSETVPDVDNTFMINVFKTANQTYRLKVYIDGKVKLEKFTRDTITPFNHVFTSGTHEMIATIAVKQDDQNYFTENDVFYKTVNVIEKPKILYISKKYSPMKQLLDKMYNIDQISHIPSSYSEIDDYYSIIVNDMPADEFSNSQVDNFEEFLNEGNGLLVVGGQKSYDYGDYQGSYLETILPTQAGEGKKIDESKQKLNVIFVIDISRGSGDDDSDRIATEKAQAINIMQSIRSTDRVGVIAFNSEVYCVSATQLGCGLVDYKINKDLLSSNIQKLPFGGISRLGPAIIFATDLLKDHDGRKSIIILSDGYTTNRPKIKGTADNILETAKYSASHDVTIFSLGVPQNRPWAPINIELLQDIAEITGGTYDLASRANNVILEFGDEKDREEDIPKNSLVVRDGGHFITKGLKIKDTKITGFNTIVPKSSAQTLITTGQGYPVITTWRYSLGRVVSMTTDDGRNWAGKLLSKSNSQLITRVAAYTVGNPKRLEKYYVEIEDTQVGKQSTVIVKSDELPKDDLLTFNMIEPEMLNISQFQVCYLQSGRL